MGGSFFTIKKDIKAVQADIEGLYNKFDTFTWRNITDSSLGRFEKTIEDTLDLFTIKEARERFVSDASYFNENLREAYDILDLDRPSKFASDLLPRAGVTYGVL